MAKSDAAYDLALDAYGPAEIAARVETAGIAKARLALLPLLVLAGLAGAFIAFGGMLYLLAMAGADPALGTDRILGGIAFSLGLVLVVVAGAELFTGNNLVVIAWADRRITTLELLRNWLLVYLGNFAGAAAMVGLARAAKLPGLAEGGLGTTAAALAEAKLSLSFASAFASGILCNLLVCLAIWMCFSARQVAGKVLCIVFPISAFVALGFEHSIANMFLIPFGMLAGGGGIDAFAVLGSLVPVTLGNIVGGGLLVALVYWLIYRRGRPGI